MPQSYLLMTELNSNNTASTGSISQAIEHIRLTRHQYLKNLTTNEGLDAFLENQFQTFAITSTKREFLIRDLRELIKLPLDLVHYASLIQAYKANPQQIPENEPFILRELEIIFKKYGLSRP